MTAWLDRIAADLLHVEQDLRTTLRSISRGGKPPRLASWNRLEITTFEARTLLRGVMPAPIAVSRLRRQHGRLVAALSVFSGHMLALNDPMRRPDEALAAACSMVDELRSWIATVRWQAAARKAGVKWPVPADVRALMQLSPAPAAEHLPNIQAGQLHHPAAPIRAVQQLRAEQLALDLAPASSAEVIDLRQLRLAIEPPPSTSRGGNRADTQAA